MNKKIVVIGILLIAVILISGSFNSGNDVTVNDVTFHLPEGFDVNNPVDFKNNNTYEEYIYKNNETKDQVYIAVADKSLEDSEIKNYLIEDGFEQKTIHGKEGFSKMYFSPEEVEFVYIDNDKVIDITVPFMYNKYSSNFKNSTEILEEIIK